MKIRMYMDIWPSQDMKFINATNCPTAKCEGVTRIAFNVEVPDSILKEVDVEAVGTSAIEVLT